MGALTLERLRREGPAGYPRFALRDSSTALVLFAAAYGGKQDAIWIEEAGLEADVVDLDEPRLREMGAVYPQSWRFHHADAFAFVRDARLDGRKWDVVSLDPYTGDADRLVVSLLSEICELARDVVIVGVGNEVDVVAPAGWVIVDRRRRSDYRGGTFWIVLQRAGVGIDPADVVACLVTRGDQPEMIERIRETLPYGDVAVWDNSLEPLDMMTAGRYFAAFDSGAEVVYFQDDDTIFRAHAELCALYDPGRITAVYGHGETPAGYDDLPLVCGGGLVDVDTLRDACASWLEAGYSFESKEELAYADFAIGILAPFRHVFLPFEIVYEVAQHPSRLCNQDWAADAKARITAQARAVRDRMRAEGST